MWQNSLPIRIIKFIGLLFLMLMPTALFITLTGNSTGTMQTIYSVGVLIVYLLVVWWMLRLYYGKQYQWTFKWDGRNILRIVGYALLLRIVVMVFIQIMQQIQGTSVTGNDEAILTSTMSLTPVSFIVFLIILSILGPICEEVVFRGMFTRYFFVKTPNIWLSGIMSTLLFGWLHVSRENINLLELALYSTMGGFLYYIANKHQRLSDAMWVHMLNNAIGSITIALVYFGMITLT